MTIVLPNFSTLLLNAAVTIVLPNDVANSCIACGFSKNLFIALA